MIPSGSGDDAFNFVLVFVGVLERRERKNLERESWMSNRK